MGMAIHRSDSSSYYPPRARWYAPVFYWLDGFKRALALDRLRLPPEISLGGLVAGVLVPGLAFYFRSPGILGKAALALAGLLLLVFIIWLGYGDANVAFALLLSLHVSGLMYYCTPLLEGTLARRLLVTIGTLIALCLLVYRPLQDVIQSHLLTPVEMNGQIIIVGHVSSTKSIRAGDWVAYNISSYHNYEEDAVYIVSRVGFHPGIALGPVLALPGDRIEFFTDTFSVNGVRYPRLPHMPQAGVYSVPEKEWFIWPNLAIHQHGDIAEAAVSGMMLRLAMVPEKQLIGIPFQRWFWRRQILS